jgi:hypothetical protein
VQEAASTMGKKRWKKVSKKERSALMTAARAAVKNPYTGGRKRLEDRCYCGKSSRHTATLRAFGCCKKAGMFPGQEKKSIFVLEIGHDNVTYRK